MVNMYVAIVDVIGLDCHWYFECAGKPALTVTVLYGHLPFTAILLGSLSEQVLLYSCFILYYWQLHVYAVCVG